MSEQATKKIGFLRQVETNHIDRRKLDVIESLKVKANETDERITQKGSIHVDGKMYNDVIPVVLQH